MFEGILSAMFSDHLSVLSISFVRSMKHAFFQQIPVYHQLLLMDNPMVIIPSFADFYNGVGNFYLSLRLHQNMGIFSYFLLPKARHERIHGLGLFIVTPVILWQVDMMCVTLSSNRDLLVKTFKMLNWLDTFPLF